MEAISNGFIYITESRIVIAYFSKGENQYFGELHSMFYGSKSEAIENNLIFKKDETENI